jgi:uncharacterized membrane protein
MATHPRWVRQFLSEADLDAVAQAVAAAERTTSAEIRVHLDHRCPGEAMPQAIAVFERLGMHATTERSGVLIYVAVGDRKLAVIGDRGIHERVGAGYWRQVVDAMLGHLRASRPRDGLVQAVTNVGAALQSHFPRRGDDRNELADDVSIA